MKRSDSPLRQAVVGGQLGLAHAGEQFPSGVPQPPGERMAVVGDILHEVLAACTRSHSARTAAVAARTSLPCGLRSVACASRRWCVSRRQLERWRHLAEDVPDHRAEQRQDRDHRDRHEQDDQRIFNQSLPALAAARATATGCIGRWWTKHERPLSMIRLPVAPDPGILSGIRRNVGCIIATPPPVA